MSLPNNDSFPNSSEADDLDQDWLNGDMTDDEPLTHQAWQQTWAHRLASHSLLDAQQERELLKRTRGDDPQDAARARADLLAANYRMLVKIARMHEKQSAQLELGDLIAEGLLGMNRAIDKFNLNHDVRFITYAWPWVRLYVTRAILDKGYLVRVPSSAHQQLRDLRRQVQAATAALAFAEEEGVSNEQLQQMQEQLQQAQRHLRAKLSQIRPALEASRHISLSMVDENDETDASQASGAHPSRLPSEVQQELSCEGEQQEAVLHAQRISILAKHLRKLPAQQRYIIEARYGFGGHEAKSLQAIAQASGIPTSEANQLCKQAMLTLRQMLEGDGLTASDLTGSF